MENFEKVVNFSFNVSDKNALITKFKNSFVNPNFMQDIVCKYKNIFDNYFDYLLDEEKELYKYNSNESAIEYTLRLSEFIDILVKRKLNCDFKKIDKIKFENKNKDILLFHQDKIINDNVNDNINNNANDNINDNVNNNISINDNINVNVNENIIDKENNENNDVNKKNNNMINDDDLYAHELDNDLEHEDNNIDMKEILEIEDKYKNLFLIYADFIPDNQKDLYKYNQSETVDSYTYRLCEIMNMAVKRKLNNDNEKQKIKQQEKINEIKEEKKEKKLKNKEQKIKTDAEEYILKRKYSKIISKNIEDGTHKAVNQYNDKLVKNIQKEIHKEKKNKMYFHITIKPKESSKELLDKIMLKLIKKKIYKIYFYVYEQRSEIIDELGKSPHLHIVVSKLIPRSALIQKINASLDKYCDTESIKIKEIHENMKDDIENRLLGNKKDIRKKLVEMDKIWRNKLNIKNIYYVDKDKKQNLEIKDNNTDNIDNKTKTKKYYFITINPIECEKNDLDKIMSGICKKKWIKIYSYVYEQRGKSEEEIGKGKHIHILIEKNKKKNEVIKEIHNTIKQYCDKEKVDVKEITEKEKNDRINYMKGNKCNDKKLLVEMDKIWRNKNGIKDYYELIKENNVNNDIINNNLDNNKINQKLEKEYDNCKIITDINNKKYIMIKINGEDKIYPIMDI